MPTWLQEPFYRAVELRDLKECGARFAYPDGLSIVEWLSMQALSRGNEKAEKMKKKAK